MGLFSVIPAAVLIGLGLLLAVGELLISGSFILIWYAIGFLLAGAATALLPEGFFSGGEIQVALALLFGTAALLIYVGKKRRTPVAEASDPDEDFSHGFGVVTADGTHLEYRGSQWMCQGEDGAPLTPGAKMEVIRRDGNLLIVRAVNA